MQNRNTVCIAEFEAIQKIAQNNSLPLVLVLVTGGTDGTDGTGTGTGTDGTSTCGTAGTGTDATPDKANVCSIVLY